MDTNQVDPKVVPEDGTLVNPDEEVTTANTEDTTSDTGEENTEQETTAEDTQEDGTGEEEKSEETEESEESKDEEEAPTEYTEYTDPALKQAVNLLTEAKVPVEEANAIFAEAVETGDLSKIDKAALIEKLGPDKADIVLVLAENYYNTQFAAMNVIKKEAHEITGGEENFDAMKEWAKTKAATNPEFMTDLNEFRDMIDSGNTRSIKAAITELFSLYTQDPETTIAANLTTGDSAVGTSNLEPMSRKEYTDAIDKAHSEGTYERDRAQLWARRSAGKKKGI